MTVIMISLMQGEDTNKERKTRNRQEAANLILVTMDQWRGDWGDPIEPIVKLKTLTKLANEGWTARRCYTSSPQCVPARLSWITGLPPSRLGITKNQSANLPGNAPSFIRKLKRKGWTTGLVGKTHWTDHSQINDLENNRKQLNELGFDYSVEIAGPRALRKIKCPITSDWIATDCYDAQMEDLDRRYKGGRNRESWKVRASVLPINMYPDIWVADQAIKMLEKMPVNKPWCLWISFVGPHEPFDTPLPWKEKLGNSKLPQPKQNNGWINRQSEESEIKKIMNIWKNKLSTQDISNLRVDYAEHLLLLDEQLKKIIEKAEKRPDYDSTAVLVTADHGEMLGDHEMLYKSTFLEPSIKVPFIYKPPANTSDARRNTSTNKPIGLTEAIHYLAKSLVTGGSIETLEEWAKTRKGVIAEYGSEIMFIRKWQKVIYNMENKVMWSTNLKKDPNESKNAAEEDYKDTKQEICLNRISKWAHEEITNRKKGSWIKLDLREE